MDVGEKRVSFGIRQRLYNRRRDRSVVVENKGRERPQSRYKGCKELRRVSEDINIDLKWGKEQRGQPPASSSRGRCIRTHAAERPLDLESLDEKDGVLAFCESGHEHDVSARSP